MPERQREYSINDYNEMYAQTDEVRKERSRVRFVTWGESVPEEKEMPICPQCRRIKLIQRGKMHFCKNCLYEVNPEGEKPKKPRLLGPKHGSASSQLGDQSIIVSKKKRSEARGVSQVTDTSQQGLSDEDISELKRAGIIQ